MGYWGGGVCFVVLCVVFFCFGLKKMKIEMFFLFFVAPVLGFLVHKKRKKRRTKT